MKIIIINGPNLNLLGKREPEMYGNQSFENYLEELKSKFPYLDLIYFQSNHEGDLIDKIQETGFHYDAIILNAGAYTHTSIALHDCIKAITTPVIEVHISNIEEREYFRKHSYITPVAQHLIMGHGLNGYEMAIRFIIEKK
ncbi:MAG: type II 3-dehydroquinate dehydratase [Flavobacteriales bacterium]